MRKLIFLLLMASTSLKSQDIIIKTDGNEILSRVIEVDQDKIRYKRYDNPDGPIYSVASPEVFIIKYANGTKDIITSLDKPSAQMALPIHNIAGQWKNTLVQGEPFRITKEGDDFFMELNGTRARLISTSPNFYNLEGVSYQLTALSADSIKLSDKEQTGLLSVYLVRYAPTIVAQTNVTQVSSASTSIIGGGLSTGIGASYGFAGLNAELRIGPKDFCLRPNVGLGVYSTLDDGTMPWSAGAKLYIDNWYIGYRYGYLGSVFEESFYFDPWTGDYYYDAYYYEPYGSVLVIGADWNFGKQDQFFLTSGVGINISGIKLSTNWSDFEFGFGVRI